NQTFTANQTGKYWVNVYKDRCMISDTIQITESDLELDLGNDTIFCHNTFIHLDAKNIGSTYTWSDGSANQTFTANQTGQYWVNVYKDRCMISDSIQITESDLELDLGNDTIFCHNTFIHLDAKNIGSTYTWSDGSANQTFTANQTGKYWVNVYKDRCMISDSIQITESDLELDLGNDTTFCEGLSLMLNAHNTGAAYLWSTNQASQTINVNQTGNYWVRVSKDGCYITDTIDIIVSPLPRAAQIISASLGLCSFGFEIQNPTHVEQYIWDFGDQFRDSSGQSVEHAYRENKHYLVKAIISNACGMKEFQTAVNCSGLDEKNILRLYPNPAQTEITLRINSYEEFFSKITITNSLGQQIYLEDTNLISIANINIGQFSNGVYNVTILTNKGNTYTQKFVKAE
ncbi:MAG: T9SS type A sorting domain-containing protein, partial [Bacteroidetes bacterium]|nr:T9SS type A sorting domain-containing protein [Bacteroidota bacterium]